jgi:hypothetical protein
LFSKTQQLFLSLMERQSCPFDELVAAYDVRLDVFFSLVDFVPRFSISAPVSVPAKAKFGLELEVDTTDPAETVFTWVFDENRIPTSDVAALASVYLSLWSSLCSSPSSALSLPLRHASKRLFAHLSFGCSYNAATVRARLAALAPHIVVSEIEQEEEQEEQEDDESMLHVSVRDSECRLFSSCLDLFSLRVIASSLSSLCSVPPLLLPRDHADLEARLALWSARLQDCPLFADLPCDFARTCNYKKKLVANLSCVEFAASPLLSSIDPVELSVICGIVLQKHCVRQG